MKRIKTTALCMLLGVAAMAQETYESATIADRDLNGTARYVGMGGALDALGADISTISSNPAGVGLFRRSTGNISFGAQIVADQEKVLGGDKASASFDQAGFVLATKTNNNSYLNFAFNYHKSKNFNQLFSAMGNLGGKASQNKLSYIKNVLGYHGSDDPDYSMVDELYHKSVNGTGSWTKGYADMYDYFNADMYDSQRKQSGYISNFDFNISGNVNDRFFWGFTFGLKDVRYRSYSEYTETLSPGQFDPKQYAGVMLSDEREIKGTGFDFTLGAIVRPIEDSPFRIGLSISTPTFYRLTTYNYTYLCKDYSNDNFGNTDITNGMKTYVEGSYDFALNTPWRFGLSLGHTIDNMFAIGASLDYESYSSLDNRYRDTSYYGGTAIDWWGWEYDYYGRSENSYSDKVMNRHTEESLKGVVTAKVGAEVKPDEHWAVRLGYNYVSPKYNKDAFKNSMIDSDAITYASQTDYVNWDATHRLTCGFGWNNGLVSVDLAYQYQTTKGQYHPFMDSWAEITDPFTQEKTIIENYADAVDVKQNRHQVLLTIGYKF